MNSIGRLKLPKDDVEKTQLLLAVDNIRRTNEWETAVELLIKPNLEAELEVLETQMDEKILLRAQGRRSALNDILKLFEAVEKAVRDGKRTI